MDYKATLQLPRTDFPMKADLAKREPEAIARWDALGVYRRVLEKNQKAGGARFLLHDGPPYANGHIHMGHVLNKVLKDVFVRYFGLRGHVARYVPGWDCHGLPIELAVEKELGNKRRDMPPAEFRRACRAYAERFVDIQRNEFKRLGIQGEWDAPYLTMDYRYEATIARELGRFVENGSLYRAKMPVYWCASCATALAEAEVEYEEKESPSVYVAFPIDVATGPLAPYAAGPDRPAAQAVHAVIWTTTPWTLLANLAIAINPEYEYVVVRRSNGQHLLLAKELAEKAFTAMGLGAPDFVAVFKGRDIEGSVARHPWLERPSPILFGDHVTLEAGTGCVHTAPGHGQEDFVLGRAHGLPPYAPVDRRGRFTEEAGPDFAGVPIHEGSKKVEALLHANGALLNPPGQKLRHQYPHCWRCKKPVLFRATEQWFISMEKTGLRKQALEEIERVQWIPAWGKDRIYGMIANRPDWCVSRQRSWGVPIPAVYCTACEHVHTSPALVQRAAARFEQEGADAWFTHEAAEFLEPGHACEKCGGREFAKENDILDVWFDSGVSFAAVAQDKMGEATPVELYLEGSDQHRGWFHSSLLASVGTRGAAPYQAVLTHGFVVDQSGRAMSKSLGNYVAASESVEKLGAEILRLWVATQDYRNDNPCSQEILKGVADAYRKIRNTLRFLVSNIGDFDPAQHTQPRQAMSAAERWILSRLHTVTKRIQDAYEKYEFHRFYVELVTFCSSDLSAFYLDVTKDRLYCAAQDDVLRRSIQTVMYEIARTLCVLCAPVLCFTSDEVWQYLPAKQHGGAPREESVHLCDWPTAVDADANAALEDEFQRLRAVKASVDALLEVGRRDKQLGASLEAWVTVGPQDGAEAELLKRYEPALAELFIVSRVTLDHTRAGITFHHAPDPRCDRCWRYTGDVTAASAEAASEDAGALCVRCAKVLDGSP